LTRPCLLLTRPTEETTGMVREARLAGFDTLAAPLLEIVPLEWSVPADARPDSLLFTSARAPAFSMGLPPELKQLPAYAVGPNTQAAARKAGFRVVTSGTADGSAIVAHGAADGRARILHLSGEQTARIIGPPGVRLIRVPVYAARLVPALSDCALSALRSGSLFATLLFSSRTARHYRQLLEKHHVPVAGQRIIALSPAIVSAAGQGWRDVAIASSPSREQALAAALGLWQGLRHG
jgi:uroporphyrinogen-III synthase